MTKTAIATPDRPDDHRPAGLDDLLAHVADSIGTEQPAEDGDRLAVVDGRDALAYVLISPGDKPGTVEVEAGARGLAKSDAALVLREVARQWSPSPILSALRAAGAPAAEGATEGIRKAEQHRADGGETLLDVLGRLAGKTPEPGACAFTLMTGLPCPEHGTPAADAEAVEEQPEPQPAPAEEPRTVADAVSKARQALDFNSGQHSPALSTLRDVLLSGDYGTPDTALAVAYVILAQHARELARQVADRYDGQRSRFGVTRSTRGLLTGLGSARRLLDEHATALDVNASFAAALK
ncbi:hypothetical protein [Streptomyces sp. NPDC026673]|uniref:hypothetical protein n=1 Tax=Streptomyces sp. NPDC026673 TaxID=3155724 RepID=UPI0033E0B79F